MTTNSDNPKHLGLHSWLALAARLRDLGFKIDPDLSNVSSALAEVTFIDCGQDGIMVNIDLSDGAWLGFRVPAHVESFTAAEWEVEMGGAE